MSRLDKRIDKHSVRLSDLEGYVVANGLRIDGAEEAVGGLNAWSAQHKERISSLKASARAQAEAIQFDIPANIKRSIGKALEKVQADMNIIEAKIERDIKDIDESAIAHANDLMHTNKRIKAVEEAIVGHLAEDIYKSSAYVECETCGCLLRKSRAVRGESVIEREDDMAALANHVIGTPAFSGVNSTESIREVYYCLVHAKKDVCADCPVEFSDGVCTAEDKVLCEEQA